MTNSAPNSAGLPRKTNWLSAWVSHPSRWRNSRATGSKSFPSPLPPIPADPLATHSAQPSASPTAAPANPGEPDARQLSETFRDENIVDPATRLGKDEIIEEMMACLHNLDDRELEILSLKHGFHPHGQLSFRDLGRRLGVSHEWVRRIAELAVVTIR